MIVHTMNNALPNARSGQLGWCEQRDKARRIEIIQSYQVKRDKASKSRRYHLNNFWKRMEKNSYLEGENGAFPENK